MNWLVRLGNNILNDISSDLLQFIVLSIQLVCLFGILWFFRKPLNKIASTKYAIRLIGSSFFATVLVYSVNYWIFDIREWYSFLYLDAPEPLFHIFIPAKITSQIAEIPSTNAVDWLSVCLIAWIIGILILALRQYIKNRAFRRMVSAPNARILCPEPIQLKLQNLLKQDERWKFQHADEETPTHIELYYIKGLSSPCTFDTNTKRPVIALDRMDYSDAELDYILRHELAHITLKHERAISALTDLRIVCWFNPLLIPIEKWSRQQIELLTDDDVLTNQKATPAERISYARLLVNLAQERQLHGVALQLSAGAQFIRQRTEAILRPHRRAFTLPVTILLVILVLHTTLLIAPGETLESRFDSRLDLLACLGNDYKYVTRGLDPYRNEPDYQSFLFDGQPMYIEKNDDRTCRLYTYIEGDQQTADEYKGGWLNEINALLGEPIVTENLQTESYRWNVTLSPKSAERMWDNPSVQTYLTLIWSDTYGYSMTILLEEAN